MLRKLSEEIAECYRHADDCRRKANETKNQTAKDEFLEMERRWLFLARSYELTERISDFTVYAKKSTPPHESGKAQSTVGMEEDHLALNDQHIALGRNIVERQRKIIADLAAQGRDTTDAETTLALFIKSLDAFEDHRQKILAAIASGSK